MIVFDLLGRVLAVFALPGDPSRIRKRALVKLFRSIERRGPKWYRPWTNRLTEDFIEGVDELRRITTRIGTVYKATIDLAPDAARPALERVVNRLLSSHQLALTDFRFDAIKAKFDESKRSDLMEAMDALFKKRLEAFGGKEFQAANAAYRTNIKLAALCGFRWDHLMNAFGRRDRSVPAAPLAADLADLHYVLAEAEADQDAKAFFLLLREAANPSSYASEQATADFVKLDALLSGVLAGEAFGRAVRAAQGDANFELRRFTVNDELIRPIVDSINADYALRRRLFADHYAEEQLGRIRDELFGEVQLVQPEGYSPAFQSALAKANLALLDQLGPLSIIKSFVAAIYAPKLRAAIGLAVIDLDYRDITFRTALSDEADAFGFIADSVALLEDRTEVARRSDAFAGLETGIMDGPTRARAERAVRALNEQAGMVIQETFTRSAALTKRIRRLLDDMRTRTPEIIANAGFVNVHRPKTTKGLEDAGRRLDLFHTLLHSIAVDKRAIKEAVKDGALAAVRSTT